MQTRFYDREIFALTYVPTLVEFKCGKTRRRERRKANRK